MKPDGLVWPTPITMATSWLSSLWSHPLGARIAFYPSLLYGMFMNGKNRRWYDRVDSCVLLGALPFYSVARQLVENEGVKGVVTLNEEYETRFFTPSQQEWGKMGVRQLRIATVDYNNAPSLENIQKGVAFIQEHAEKEESVYVHCKTGRSRSTTVVVCYLMERENLNPEQAFRKVQEKRSHVVLGSAQYARIIEYYQQFLEK